MITVSATDAGNRPVPIADNEITFSVTGPGKIIGVGNGDPSSHESDKADKRHLFNGLAQVIVQSTGDAGDIQLTAQGENLKSASVTIHTQPTSIQGVP